MIATLQPSHIPEGGLLAVRVSENLTLVVCQLDGVYYAFDGKCPHRGAQLADGRMDKGLLVCPLHHFKFNVKTGRCVMPPHLRLRSFTIREEAGQLKIEL